MHVSYFSDLAHLLKPLAAAAVAMTHLWYFITLNALIMQFALNVLFLKVVPQSNLTKNSMTPLCLDSV